jgi:deoxyribodipyrimidine photo-lyase
LGCERLARAWSGPAGHRRARRSAGRPPPREATQLAGPGPGGEKAGRRQFTVWRQRLLGGYAEHHDDLAGDATSRLSAYLRFGCVSPLEVAFGARDRPGGEEFCRQLAWRDFFYQVAAAFPDIARKNYRPGASRHHDQHALDAWRAGQTGIPG